MNEKDEKRASLLIHQLGFFGYVVPIVGNLLPLWLFWRRKREESKVLEAHGVAALNYQITVSIVMVCLWVTTLFLFGVGFVLFASANIAHVCSMIWVNLQVSEGEEPEYPLTFQFINRR